MEVPVAAVGGFTATYTLSFVYVQLSDRQTEREREADRQVGNG